MTPQTKIKNIIPVIGFGTWQITGKKCVESVEDAINIGYKHIDTAQMYENEIEVGRGIRQSATDREDLFLTTKIATSNNEPKRIHKSTHESLQRLSVDYVDLLLIHWPTPDMNLEACLEAMFQLKEEGKIKNVGVSNFSASLYEKALQFGRVVNNQVKFSPYQDQKENLDVAHKYKTTITAYSPLERGGIASDKTLSGIAENYNKTPAQITLRWLIQRGNVSVIPKASSQKHRKENIEIFDFELTQEEMDAIRKLNR